MTVDGEVVEQPQFKVEGQTVALLPGATPEQLEPMTLLLNQPAGLSFEAAQRVLTPRKPAGRTTVPMCACGAATSPACPPPCPCSRAPAACWC